MKIESKDDEYTTIDFKTWNAWHYCVAFCPVAVVAVAMILAFFIL